jgi:hypothetical protein
MQLFEKHIILNGSIDQTARLKPIHTTPNLPFQIDPLKTE